MLTPEQITALRDISGQLMDPVTEFLIRDIARRVSEAGQLTGTAAYQTWRLQKLGVSQRQLKKELRRLLKVSHRQLRQLLTQAAETGYDFDIRRFPQVQSFSFEENTSLQQILDASVKLAQDDLTNITQTIGFVTPTGKAVGLTEAYQKTCDFAFMKVTTGAQDYISAVRDATRGLAEKGIQVIDYESGVRTSLEAAVRRNIMGGLGLMQEQISQQNHDALGCDGWEISAHAGSAPDHEPIQGKQYRDEVYTRLNNSLKRRIGTLNCGHSASPIIFGVNNPQYTDEELEDFRQKNEEGVTVDGKKYTLYEATQRQRSLERSIRKRKHHILIDEELGDTEKLQQDQIHLQILKQRYHEFSKAAKLPEQYERMEKAGFTWKHGRAAEKAAIAAHKKQETTTKTKKVATQAQKTLAKSSNRGTMKLELTDTDTRAIHDYMSAKSYAVNEKLRTGAPLTNEEQTFLNDLDAALKKMPTYQGNLQRSLIFETDEDVQAFMRTHTKGAVVKYDQYISTTQGTAYNPEGQVQILINNARRGRDISALNPSETEVLYERGMAFKVVGVRKVGGKYYLLMEESDE